MKFLSIIIPHYSEKEKDIFPLLSSISNQVGVDFNDIEVIIANDGGAYQLNEDLFSLFNMGIKQINLKENLGPGVARQAGLDIAQGEYVTFCDADDTLYSVGVLRALMREAHKEGVDYLSSSWLEEIKQPNGSFTYKTHEIEYTWMHGKLFRRGFLNKNNIKFHPDLRVHEDSYILAIIMASTNRARYMPITSYMWKWHPDSITRRNEGEYTFSSVPTFLKAVTMADAEIEKRNPAIMEEKIIQLTLYQYFTNHMPIWLDPTKKKYLDDAEKAFIEYIKPFWHYWQEAKPESVAKIYTEERDRIFKGYIETETLDAWLERLRLQ